VKQLGKEAIIRTWGLFRGRGEKKYLLNSGTNVRKGNELGEEASVTWFL